MHKKLIGFKDGPTNQHSSIAMPDFQFSFWQGEPFTEGSRDINTYSNRSCRNLSLYIL
nr:MAG TPA: hypothetical protein [Bacteriophage sp.]